ncbi:glycoside hydrolase TIM-barrel-like domain-containing protein [Thioclava litoralis]|uniref:Glycoside hydrolase TIM-barrel-like domain-containing protein n=1 Tax=Thioclava litoralis TaxID=3076557 RepID=A0ABZ1DY08_9RHOB|nr:glycoside hydrolase TIM-barrel-like domain-containing protein [Thioclava sp. FTW29]
MATILLGAAGAAIGGGFGGTVLGLSGAVIGRAVGATLGRAIDQRLLGTGSQSVETGKVSQFRLSSASEGTPVPMVWGGMRVAGQVIWATRFREHASTKKSGKGTGTTVSTTSYSYSVSLALALCEGEILRVGRIWADGQILDTAGLDFRVYTGAGDQEPDAKIQAVEGADAAPAYRGIAYVVFEDLALAPFGNRVPQLTFEVFRAAAPSVPQEIAGFEGCVRGVALIPGTGEYSLATTPVYFAGEEGGSSKVMNQSAPGGLSDFATSLAALNGDLPNCEAVSLVVSWFGDDLRAGQCKIRPRVNETAGDGKNMAWSVSGVGRAEAGKVAHTAEGDLYGGTPADAAVIEAIRALRAAGKFVTFYPFILMEQIAGNARPNPWSPTEEQPALPWRGRITTDIAPGLEGSTDRSAAAAQDVAAFFGEAAPESFAPEGMTLRYSGAEEWSMRRFILHYAHLCAQAGGVDAFCVGTEMCALTQIRDAEDGFPAVEALRRLANDVRAILGETCKIGYAADWSEYFGYNSPDGNRYFHLDPLWADSAIDFVGVDNYLPLADWREGENHADAAWPAIHDLGYLQSNIEGGEYYDWYYATDLHRQMQIRTPITDGEGEPWIWRAKDFRSWWQNRHYERIDGLREEEPTAWIPQMKPIWFTEYGCAAIDKGANQPNKFLDPKSSESMLPHFSNGRRDELIQMQYVRAMEGWWQDRAHNPVSEVYEGPMIDMTKAHVWCWDARPWPEFPSRDDLWSDAENYARGHWLSGRAVAQPLARVVAEICAMGGVTAVDVSGLRGSVRGYSAQSGESPRAMLQTLMLAYGFDAVERDGALHFIMRSGQVSRALADTDFALQEDESTLTRIRASEAEMSGRVRLSYIEAEGDYATRVVEAIAPQETDQGSNSASEVNAALHRPQAVATVERWLAEAQMARDVVQFAVPPSLTGLGAGDVIAIEEERYRIDRVDLAGAATMEAVRIEAGLYEPSDAAEADVSTTRFYAPVPVTAQFMDLPLLTGEEVPYAPYLAVTASPWPGTVAVFDAVSDADYQLNATLTRRATFGRSLGALNAARAGLWDRGAPLRVSLVSGELQSASEEQLLAGANAMAIGDGSSDNWEIFQFAQAELVGNNTWDLSLRLRGQLGTDALMPEIWPEGSVVVALDGNLDQITLAQAQRNISRHYRIGSARRSYDDPSYVHLNEAFKGNGLRPYAPSHLRVSKATEDWSIGWVRRTRLNGDPWLEQEVPLGELHERYRLRLLTETGAVLREVTLEAPSWIYTASQRQADLASGSALVLEVAQLSDLYGAGLPARLALGL